MRGNKRSPGLTEKARRQWYESGRTVEKESRASEMCSGQSWERTILADGDQFAREKFEDVESGVSDQ